MSKSIEDFKKGYEIGVHYGQEKAKIEFQESNTNTDLPSNDTLYKIFDLLSTAFATKPGKNECHYLTKSSIFAT